MLRFSSYPLCHRRTTPSALDHGAQPRCRPSARCRGICRGIGRQSKPALRPGTCTVIMNTSVAFSATAISGFSTTPATARRQTTPEGPRHARAPRILRLCLKTQVAKTKLVRVARTSAATTTAMPAIRTGRMTDALSSRQRNTASRRRGAWTYCCGRQTRRSLATSAG